MPKGERIRMLLVGCGPTDWDQSGRLQGSADLPLCADGRTRAESLIAGLSGESLNTILVGPDEASRQMGKLLARGIGARIRTLPDLAEMDLGLWEGMLESGVEDRFPRAWKQWIEDPATVAVPEGESIDEVRHRILRALREVFEKMKNGSAVAVVLRPIALRVLRCWLRGTPTKELWSQPYDGSDAEWYELSVSELAPPTEVSPAA